MVSLEDSCAWRWPFHAISSLLSLLPTCGSSGEPPAVISCHSIFLPSVTINLNELSLLKVSFVMMFYHVIRKITNAHGFWGPELMSPCVYRTLFCTLSHFHSPRFCYFNSSFIMCLYFFKSLFFPVSYDL